jgi:hypothetical protein
MRACRYSLMVLATMLGSQTPVLAQSAQPYAQSQTLPRPVLKPAGSSQQMIACPAYGPGFFRQPGSTVCVKIGGSLRGEAGIRDRRSQLAPLSGSVVRGDLMLDTRTPSDYGTIRTVVVGRGTAANGGLNSPR